jgi:hypothetical protein
VEDGSTILSSPTLRPMYKLIGKFHCMPSVSRYRINIFFIVYRASVLTEPITSFSPDEEPSTPMDANAMESAVAIEALKMSTAQNQAQPA